MDQLKNRSGGLRKVELPDLKDKSESDLKPMENALAAVIAARRKAMAPDPDDQNESNDWND